MARRACGFAEGRPIPTDRIILKFGCLELFRRQQQGKTEGALPCSCAARALALVSAYHFRLYLWVYFLYNTHLLVLDSTRGYW
jgi:hypothetical protein